MYYVYILLSYKDQRFYTGITNNLWRRIREHNIGKESTPSTLSRGPFRLVHVEQVENRALARQREKYWKSGVGRELRQGLVRKMPL